MSLGPPRFYFPLGEVEDLAGPYVELVEPAAERGSGPHAIEYDAQLPRYLAAKREAMRRRPAIPVLMRGSGLEALLEQAAEYLRVAILAARPEDFARSALSQEGVDSLMLRLQEDLVVIARRPGLEAARAPAVYLHVCFPSGWDPTSMLGKTFLGFHARVPAERGFSKAERRRHAAEVFARRQARFVWGLCSDSALDHHPDSPRVLDWPGARACYLRVERQAVVPLPEGATEPLLSLFLIRTYIYPVALLGPERRARLRRAVTAMSEPLRRYKGLWGHEPTVLRLLEG